MSDDFDDEDGPFGAPVEIPIEDSIDLHRFRPAEMADVVDAYIDAAWEKGLREVRVIHGRGRGVQRNRIRRRLERHARVDRFADAAGDRGGWGATVVWLHPRPASEDVEGPDESS